MSYIRFQYTIILMIFRDWSSLFNKESAVRASITILYHWNDVQIESFQSI